MSTWSPHATGSGATTTFADSEEVLVNLCRTPFFGVAYRGIEYWKQCADLDAADRDADTLHQSRRLSASVTWRGTVAIDGMLDPLGGEVFKTELDRLCDQLRLEDFRDGVERTAQQRRADALVEMAMRSATAPADGLRPRPLLTVTIGIDPFNHLCQTAAGTVIAPGLLMPLLGDADIERIVYDPPNRNISASRRSRFSGAVRRIIEIRDQRCQHPGCDEPAARCDADHIVPRSQGGITCLCNGQLLCAYHNRIFKMANDKTALRRPPPAGGTHPCPHPEHHHSDLAATGTDDTAGDDPSRAPPDPVETEGVSVADAGPSISSAAVHGSTSPASTASVSLRQRSSPHCSSARWRTRWARISPSSSRRRDSPPTIEKSRLGGVMAVLLDTASQSVSTPSPVVATVDSDRRSPLGCGTQIEHLLEVPAGRIGAGAIGLVDHEDVGDLHQAGLVRLHAVAPSRVDDDDRRIGLAGDLDLDLAHANGLDEDQSPAEGIEQAHGFRRGEGETAEMALVSPSSG